MTQESEQSKPIEVIRQMVEGLNDHVIEGQDSWWHPGAKWRGPAGAGLMEGLESFQRDWQQPFLEAFPDKQAHDLIRISEGRYVAAAGYQEATHRGEFMGVPATGRKVRIRYMDFWEVDNGKIVDNWVLIDFVDLLRQMGVDPLGGKGMDSGKWTLGKDEDGGCGWGTGGTEQRNAEKKDE